MMNLAGAKAHLYGLSPESFLEHRNQLVAHARAAKDRDLAHAVGQLRRPTRTAWLLNQLTRHASERLHEFLDLRHQLTRAQQEGDWAQLRSLSTQRRTLMLALLKEATRLGQESGYLAPDRATTDEIDTLEAALADDGVREQLVHGTLTKAARYGGFGVELPTHTEPSPGSDSPDLMALLAASLPKSPTPAVGSGAPEPEPGEDAVGAQRARRVERKRRSEAERLERDQRTELERLETASRQAQLAADQAENEADQATTEADELAERVGALREELSTTEAAVKRAAESARGARVTARTLRQQAVDAEAAVAAHQV